MKNTLMIAMAIGLVMLTGCSILDEQAGAGTAGANSSSAVTARGGDEVGESVLERAADGIVLNVDACCVTPGNAYTVWWLIGDVELSMTSTAIKSKLATGFIADGEEVDLELILDAGADGIEDPNDGVRIAMLDHGPDTGDPKQLTTPEGGCRGMCPVVLRTSHAAP